MEKYFGIHHRYENKITRVRRFLFILHTTATADLLTIFRFPKYLKIGIEIFKYLNNLMFKYSDIWNIWILYSHEIHADSKFGQTYYRIWFWQCIVEQKEHQWFWGIISQLADDIRDIFSECMLKANVCFVLIFFPLLFGLSDFYTNAAFHSLNNMLHSNF